MEEYPQEALDLWDKWTKDVDQPNLPVQDPDNFQNLDDNTR